MFAYKLDVFADRAGFIIFSDFKLPLILDLLFCERLCAQAESMLPRNVLQGLRSWFVAVFAKAVAFFPTHFCEHFAAKFLNRNTELRVCTNLQRIFAFLKLWKGFIVVVLIEKLLLLPALL